MTVWAIQMGKPPWLLLSRLHIFVTAMWCSVQASSHHLWTTIRWYPETEKLRKLQEVLSSFYSIILIIYNVNHSRVTELDNLWSFHFLRTNLFKSMTSEIWRFLQWLPFKGCYTWEMNIVIPFVCFVCDFSHAQHHMWHPVACMKRELKRCWNGHKDFLIWIALFFSPYPNLLHHEIEAIKFGQVSLMAAVSLLSPETLGSFIDTDSLSKQLQVMSVTSDSVWYLRSLIKVKIDNK